jgi:hypothetical protein
MKTSKYFLFAAIFVLLTGLSFGVMAQGRMSSGDSIVRLPPPEPIFGPSVRVNAIEVSDGTMGFDNQRNAETMFGYSFLGRTTGSLPGSFNLSMNCAPAIPMAGEISEVTGGTWTLPVYMADTKAGGYAGSLYGTIAKGTMLWDQVGSAEVYIVLNVKGGTQTWDSVEGFATFTGTIFVDEKTKKTMLSGELLFNFISIGADQP